MSAKTVVISVSGRSYPISTEEPEELYHTVAAELEGQIAEFTGFLKGKTEAEVVTLVAFDNAKLSHAVIAENAGLKRQIDEAQVIISDVTRKVGDADRKIDELNKQVAALTAENIDLTGKVTVLTSDNAKLSENVTVLTSDNAKLSENVTALTSDNAKLSEKVTALTSDNAKLSEKVTEATNSAALSASEATSGLILEKEELAKKLDEITKKYEILEKDKENQIQQGLSSAIAEFDSISGAEIFREEELRKKFQDYERQLNEEIGRRDAVLAERDAEIAELRKAASSGGAVASGAVSAAVAGDDGKQSDFRELLAQYEKNFNEYVTSKEAEIAALQKRANDATEELASVKKA